MSNNEEQQNPQRRELTSDEAKVCLEFLSRTDIKGGEAQNMLALQQVLSGYISNG
jgi:hypothetical protein